MGAAYRFVTMLTKLVACLGLWALLAPVYMVGLAARLLWNGLLSGWRSDDYLLEWLTGDGRAWTVKTKPPTAEGGQ